MTIRRQWVASRKGTEKGTSISIEARERWEQLVDSINAARTAYYQHERPTLSDEEYDLLYRELEDLEREHPELASGESLGDVRAGTAPGAPVLAGQCIQRR
jgi:NAD-dependent DNA ligase